MKTWIFRRRKPAPQIMVWCRHCWGLVDWEIKRYHGEPYYICAECGREILEDDIV